MNILRRLLSGLLAVLFQFLILVFPLVTALAVVLHSPESLEATIKNSGLYDKVVPAILNQSAKQAETPTKAGEEADMAALLKEPRLQQAAQQAFSPQLLENTSNQAINGIFAWLQGKTTEPQFSIDLSGPRQALIENLNQYALERASALPSCTPQQLSTLEPGQSVLDAPCLPPSISAQTAAAQFSQEALKNTEFLNKATFSASDLPKNENGQRPFDNIQWIPQAYHWLMLAPWIAGSMILLSALGIIFLHNERWAGIRRVAVCLIIAAILLLLGILLQRIIFNPTRLSQAGVNFGNPELQTTLLNMVSALLSTYARLVTIFGVTYLVLGVGGVLLARQLRPKKEPVPIPPAVTTGEQELPNPAQSRPTDPSKQPDKKIT